MSRVVVIEKNKDGKIELAKEELQKMLDDAYTQGYTDGKGRYETITYPSNPFWSTTINGTSGDSNIIATNRNSMLLNCSDVGVKVSLE